jgi:hypothetical protein
MSGPQLRLFLVFERDLPLAEKLVDVVGVLDDRAEFLLLLGVEERSLVDLLEVMLQSGLDSDGSFLPSFAASLRARDGGAAI